MGVGEYALGLVVLAATLGSSLVVGALVVRRRLGELRGADRATAFALVATAALALVHLVPGVLGVLSPGAAAAAGVLLAATCAWRLASRPAGAPARRDAPAPDGPLSRLLAGLAVLGAGAFALAAIARRLTEPITSIDMLSFHLPGVARWVQDGTLWQVDQFVPDQAHANYPHTGDLIQLAVVLPWQSDALVRLSVAPFVALTAVAVYALAVELGARRAPAALVAAVLCSLPVVVDPALVQGMPDAILLATFSGGLLFLARHARTRRTSDLVLAGVGLGLAFGTKWYGVSSVVVVAGVWLAATALARRPVVRPAAALTAVIAAAGGFWLLRNLIASGNPVFPVRVELLGVTLFDAPFDRVRAEGGFSVAHYLGDVAVWREYLAPAFTDLLGVAGAALLVAVVVAGAQGLRPPRRDGRLVSGAVAAALLVVVYAITPYTALGPEGRPVQADANVRYLVPALLVAAPLAAVAVTRLGRLRPVGEVALLALLLEALVRSYDVPRGSVVLAGLLLAAVAVAGLRLARSGPRPGLTAAAAVLGAVVLCAAGLAQQRDTLAGRYTGADGPIGWITRSAPEGQRIGLAGWWSNEGLAPTLPAFGPRLENDVVYVGPFVDEMLRRHRAREPFLAHVRRERLGLVVVGRAPATAPEEGWLRADGWREVSRDRRLTLLRAPAVSGTASQERDRPAR